MTLKRTISQRDLGYVTDSITLHATGGVEAARARAMPQFKIISECSLSHA